MKEILIAVVAVVVFWCWVIAIYLTGRSAGRLEFTDSLAALNGRLEAIPEWVAGCDPITSHPTLDAGKTMVQVLCPDSLVPRLERPEG